MVWLIATLMATAFVCVKYFREPVVPWLGWNDTVEFGDWKICHVTTSMWFKLLASYALKCC